MDRLDGDYWRIGGIRRIFPIKLSPEFRNDVRVKRKVDFRENKERYSDTKCFWLPRRSVVALCRSFCRQREIAAFRTGENSDQKARK